MQGPTFENAGKGRPVFRPFQKCGYATPMPIDLLSLCRRPRLSDVEAYDPSPHTSHRHSRRAQHDIL